MRIALAVHQFFPRFTAGTEVLTLGSAKELQARGHNVEVWAGSPDGDVPGEGSILDVVHDGVRVRQSRHARHDDPAAASRFLSELTRFRPDVVHFFHFAGVSAEAVDACVSAGVPSVYTPTDFWMICQSWLLRLPSGEVCEGPDAGAVNCVRHMLGNTDSGWKRTLIERVPERALPLLVELGRGNKTVSAVVNRPAFLRDRMNRIDRVLAPTRLMERLLVRNGLEASRARLVPYGIEMSPYAELPAKSPADRLRVGFMGAFQEFKGPHVLLEALALLPRELPLSVVVYGNPAENPGYAERVRALAERDSRVELRGRFPNGEIAKVFAELDVLVVPSLWYENTPLVIYSAQAARTPVIATNLGGMAEVIEHEKNGLLFDVGDVKGLAALLRRAVDEPELLPRLAANAKSPSSISQYVDALDPTYRELTAERRSA